jgi:NUC153 domain
MVLARTGDLGKFYELASASEEEQEEILSQGESDNHEGAVEWDAWEGDEEENKVDYARGQGPLPTSSSSEDGDETDTEFDATLTKEKAALHYGTNPLAIDESRIPRGEASHRLAVLNLDWENIEAEDLFVLFNSFKPSPLSRILSVKIFLSQFGRDRIKFENLHGPPAHLFHAPEKRQNRHERASESDREVGAASASESHCSGSDGGEDTAGKDFNEEALRAYQLERLRYYYAIVECDSVETARAIYDNCDGREFEKTCNFLDLRYVPNTDFFPDTDAETGDMLLYKSCLDSVDTMKRLESYKAKDFTTQVLQHAKVTLTWDEDDPKRVKATRVKFSKDKLDDMDFKAYLASTASEPDTEDDANGSLVKLGSERHEDMIAKYKQLVMQGERKTSSVFARGGDLVGADESSGIDMEMTFEPGDNKSEGSAEEAEADGRQETVFHASLRKRREKIKAAKAALRGTQASYEHTKSVVDQKLGKPLAQKKVKQEDAKLALFMPSSDEEKRHFNMADIVKRDKAALKKLKGLKNKKRGMRDIEGAEVEDTFTIQVDDPRFVDILQDPIYAIDPSNPSYKDTKAMRKVLAEKQKRIKMGN